MKKAFFCIILLLPCFALAQTTDMYFDKGVQLFNDKDLPGALDYFTKEIELNPANVMAYNYRGMIKSRLNDPNGAMADFSKEIAINPQSFLGYSNRANEKNNIHDYKGARSEE